MGEPLDGPRNASSTELFRWIASNLVHHRLGDPDRIPYHEAGHAIVAHHHRYTVKRVTSLPEMEWEELSLTLGRATCDLPWPDADEPSWPVLWFRCRTIATVQLAGLVAERMVLGLPTEGDDGWHADLASVESILESVYPTATAADRARYRVSAERRAEAILSRNRRPLDALAQAIRGTQTIEGEDLAELLQPVSRRRRRPSDRAWTASEWDQSIPLMQGGQNGNVE